MTLRIFHDTISSPLGPIGLGVSERGVCFLGFCDNAPQSLAEYYPGAELVADSAAVSYAARAAQRFFAGEPGEITLDVVGTALQGEVWQALCEIPRGQTVSYSALAISVGRPRAVRAVANAVGANPVSLFIPCHRVLRSGGALGGYAWGVDVKEKLLALEFGGKSRSLRVNGERVQPSGELLRKRRIDTLMRRYAA